MFQSKLHLIYLSRQLNCQKSNFLFICVNLLISSTTPNNVIVDHSSDVDNDTPLDLSEEDSYAVELRKLKEKMGKFTESEMKRIAKIMESKFS